MANFLNRLLGMPVDIQNRLFKYVTDTPAVMVRADKMSCRYHMGILALSGLTLASQTSFPIRNPTGVNNIELRKFERVRGITWKEAEKIAREKFSFCHL